MLLLLLLPTDESVGHQAMFQHQASVKGLGFDVDCCLLHSGCAHTFTRQGTGGVTGTSCSRQCKRISPIALTAAAPGENQERRRGVHPCLAAVSRLVQNAHPSSDLCRALEKLYRKRHPTPKRPLSVSMPLLNQHRQGGPTESLPFQRECLPPCRSHGTGVYDLGPELHMQRDSKIAPFITTLPAAVKAQTFGAPTGAHTQRCFLIVLQQHE